MKAAKTVYKLHRLYRLYTGIAMSILSRYPIGSNVYDREWDVLIVLDTCRLDALREVAPEYEFIEDVDSIVSLGSATSEWVAQTFSRDRLSEVQRTSVVTAKYWYEKVLDEGQTPTNHVGSPVSMSKWDTVTTDDFQSYLDAFRYDNSGGPERRHNPARPQFMSDRAIEIYKKENPKRLIVHYSQPHAPHDANALKENREMEVHEKNPWQYLRDGGDLSTVWASYLDHLRFALDGVELLLKGIDAKSVAITADHGDAFGEWYVYSHGVALPHPKVRVVPWATTSAIDTEEYEPVTDMSENKEETGEEQLEALGYL